MPGKGLNRERIISAAMEQIEKEGLAVFSLRNLASALGIRASSLYNHVKGQNDLLTEVGACALSMLAAEEEAAISGKYRDEALFALAGAYRGFAKRHTELYRIIMGIHTLELPLPEEVCGRITEPILKVISDYGIEGERQIHYQRALRSVMHGFFAHENGGAFALSHADREESYRISIECIAKAMTAYGEDQHAEQ